MLREISISGLGAYSHTGCRRRVPPGGGGVYELGLSEVEIEDIKQDYQHNEMRRVAMLRKWASKFGDKSTLRTLIEVSVENNWISFIRSVCSSLGYVEEHTGYGKWFYFS